MKFDSKKIKVVEIIIQKKLGKKEIADYYFFACNLHWAGSSFTVNPKYNFISTRTPTHDQSIINTNFFIQFKLVKLNISTILFYYPILQ